MSDNDKIHIPKNVKSELQFFRGYGIKELIITIIVGIITLIPTIFLFKFGKTTLAIIIFLVTIASTIMLVKKDDKNVSFLYQLKLVAKSIFMQKSYKYGKKK